LRGMAILLVFAAHYLGGAGHVHFRSAVRHVFAAVNIGWSGVDLFFVLSGFLIGGILLEAKTAPHYFRAFYMRRVHRILPIYYSWILLYAVVVLVALAGGPNPFSASERELRQILPQFLFLQNFQLSLYPFQHAWFVVTWSLAVEEQFYLFAPLVVRFLSTRNLLLALLSAIAGAPLMRFLVFRYWSPNTLAASYLLPCRADALAFGVLLAVGWRSQTFRAFAARHRRVLQWMLFVLFAGLCCSLRWMVGQVTLLRATIGYSWLALLFSCLLLLALSQTDTWLAGIFRWKSLRWLGTISYCVYIIHLTILLLLQQLILHGAPEFSNLQGVAVTALAAIVTLALAALSWRYFEKPLIRRGHTYAYEQDTSRALFLKPSGEHSLTETPESNM
jgi:peptidoglycan/LPS O-acetylase OafA/YrhL